eukprot:scaffold1042_cov401-Prasinococcus_capsulatus_cf.AAC.53
MRRCRTRVGLLPLPPNARYAHRRSPTGTPPVPPFPSSTGPGTGARSCSGPRPTPTSSLSALGACSGSGPAGVHTAAASLPTPSLLRRRAIGPGAGTEILKMTHYLLLLALPDGRPPAGGGERGDRQRPGLRVRG